ncbi:pyridoxamine 5'-phosphate oxidase family protein [Aureibaculum conchae]|uniref:pyridoxamine 5'-phosphate oxidase family protein n=1 Tax=Aureibaculum sp. 2308TA14-22 TaxID=3108392 RepID=UPI00339318E6
MDIIKNWSTIRTHFNKSFRSNLHVSIASVDAENNPTVTPIGTFFLNGDQTGFYFEKYPTKLPKNINSNNNICVLGVNSNKWFWLKSLFKVKFDKYPALKLYGELGHRRKATEIEISRLKRRMKTTNSLKGNKYLWGDMEYVREICFTKAEKVNIGKMTSYL